MSQGFPVMCSHLSARPRRTPPSHTCSWGTARLHSPPSRPSLWTTQPATCQTLHTASSSPRQQCPAHSGQAPSAQCQHRGPFLLLNPWSGPPFWTELRKRLLLTVYFPWTVAVKGLAYTQSIKMWEAIQNAARKMIWWSSGDIMRSAGPSEVQVHSRQPCQPGRTQLPESEWITAQNPSASQASLLVLGRI